jgi:hypothetical protein
MAPSTSKKHFCCVLPLRVSVLVLGTISVVLSGALSGALYYFAFREPFSHLRCEDSDGILYRAETTSKSIPHLTGSAKTAVIVLAVAMTVVFICSIIGWACSLLSISFPSCSTTLQYHRRYIIPPQARRSICNITLDNSYRQSRRRDLRYKAPF